MHPEYTTIAKLILRGLKMVNDHRDCDRTTPSRDADKPRAAASRRRNFFLRVGNQLGIGGLLGFKHRVHAFRRNDRLTFVIENEGRVLAVEHDDIDGGNRLS